MLTRRLDIWLPTYAIAAAKRLVGKMRRRNTLTHIVFLICDHFEPEHHVLIPGQGAERIKQWRQEYARMQAWCATEYGSKPVHTWFYPPHHGIDHIPALCEMVFSGLGEVELHYHHDGDTEASLRQELKSVITEYQRWGLLLESGMHPRTAFGFVHGDWALCNSGNGKYCGVNDEISILQELGCWADFTMPSANESQTRKINSIYYGVSNSKKPKGHDWGESARVGTTDREGLLMMQGPLAINWRAPGYPRIENSSLTSENWGRADRIAKWLDCQIHVAGKPDWLFVKLHAHGANERDFDAMFGEKAYEMHRTLNEQFNDGKRYKLHYATARQAFNIAKAAEAGLNGDPSIWMDFKVKPQPHSFYTLDAEHKLVHCTANHLKISDICANASVVLHARIGAVERASGAFSSFEVDGETGTITLSVISGHDAVALELKAGEKISSLTGAVILEDSTVGDRSSLRLRVESHCHIQLACDASAKAA